MLRLKPVEVRTVVRAVACRVGGKVRVKRVGSLWVPFMIRIIRSVV